jgi:hypothetical protein
MSDPSEGQYRDVERDERWVLVIVAQGGRALRNCGLKADAFELPLHREAFTFLEKYPDWVVPKPGPLYELVIELRAAPAQPIADIFSIVTRMTSAAVAKRAAEQRCPETGDHRYSNSTNDTRTHAGEPGVPQQVAPRSIGPRRRASGRVTSGDLFQKEQNQLRGELRVFFRWKHKDGGKVTDDELKSFISRLSNQLAPRDPLDPNSVSPQDLGAHFQLTFARRKQIEDKETVRRANWPTRWPKRYRKPPRFRFHKIGADPADMSPEEIADRYKVERNERYNAKRRTARELKRELAKAI